jgi:hypothetical protein
VRQPKKSFPADKCIYLISLDDAAYTTVTLQETRWLSSSAMERR